MLERFINPLIGEVVDVKRHPNGFVKYKIRYIYNGKKYNSWSSWIKYDGYEVGNSIAIKVLHFPKEKTLFRIPIDVNSNPQTHPVIDGLFAGSCCALIGAVCFAIGRASKRK